MAVRCGLGVMSQSRTWTRCRPWPSRRVPCRRRSAPAGSARSRRSAAIPARASGDADARNRAWTVGATGGRPPRSAESGVVRASFAAHARSTDAWARGAVSLVGGRQRAFEQGRRDPRPSARRARCDHIAERVGSPARGCPRSRCRRSMSRPRRKLRKRPVVLVEASTRKSRPGWRSSATAGQPSSWRGAGPPARARAMSSTQWPCSGSAGPDRVLHDPDVVGDGHRDGVG